MVIPRWRGEPIIATDFPYSDLDRDGQPELAIGRWPVIRANNWKSSSKKPCNTRPPAPAGPERARVNLVAGVGGFGALTDAAIEQGARTVITRACPIILNQHLHLAVGPVHIALTHVALPHVLRHD